MTSLTPQRMAPPRLGDAYVGPEPRSFEHEITAGDVEAIGASSLVPCFEIGAPVHCELPPEPLRWWEFAREDVGFDSLPPPSGFTRRQWRTRIQQADRSEWHYNPMTDRPPTP